ncbi:hypothetical protein BOX15_Mlig009997g5, partial [Macrostomum lignano]
LPLKSTIMRVGRLKITELLKFLVACGIGYTLRVLIESSNYKYSSSLAGERLNAVNSISESETVEQTRKRLCGDIHEQLKMPYRPGHENETIEYRFFTLDTLYDVHRSVPRTSLKKYQSNDIRQLLHEAFPLLNAEGGHRFDIDGLRGGYERIDPLRGKEYILYLNLSRRKRTGKSSEIAQLRLVRPFSSLYVTSRTHYGARPTAHEAVHLILPAPFELVSHLLAWLEDFSKRVFPSARNVQVSLVVFNLGNNSPEQLKPLRDGLSRLEHARPGLHLTQNLILTQRRFSSAFGKRLAMKRLPMEAELVLADLFFQFRPDFFDRCRSALMQKQLAEQQRDDNDEPAPGPSDSVLSVVPFSLYSKEFSASSSTTAAIDSLSIDKSTGYWDHESRDIYCIRRRTFDKVGGFTSSSSTSSKLSADSEAGQLLSTEANRRLFANIVRRGSATIELVRSADPGVYLNHHVLPGGCPRYALFGYMTLAECRARLDRSLASRVSLAERMLGSADDAAAAAAGATGTTVG